MQQVVQTGKVCININGENGDYFKTYKGLRQGDPLSPLLFDFVGEGLAEMLNSARVAGHIKGLAGHLVEGGVSHLQYADDTIILMENDMDRFITIKFLLYCYEVMSGLKINYQKSEILGVGVDEEEFIRIANMFNCNMGVFPLKYLGLPVSCNKLLTKDLTFVAQKLRVGWKMALMCWPLLVQDRY
jgi:hypothetical protein